MKPTDFSGPVPAGDFFIPAEDYTVIPAAEPLPVSFETMLDEICERLEDTNHQGSLKRIQKLEAALVLIEDELNTILADRSFGE
ncbi:hypothetical protein AGMMS50230_17780 [Spirochaetia bacterium]|nr:hypothetical protein AGMMS50230_17780 [Spirochaetia bacterium]